MSKYPLPLAQEEDHLAHLQKYLRTTKWSYDRCRDASYSNILWNARNAYYVDRLRLLLQSLGFHCSTDLLHTFTKKSKQFRLLHDPTLSTDQWTYTLQFICFHCCTDPNDPTKIIKIETLKQYKNNVNWSHCCRSKSSNVRRHCCFKTMISKQCTRLQRVQDHKQSSICGVFHIRHSTDWQAYSPSFPEWVQYLERNWGNPEKLMVSESEFSVHQMNEMMNRKMESLRNEMNALRKRYIKLQRESEQYRFAAIALKQIAEELPPARKGEIEWGKENAFQHITLRTKSLCEYKKSLSLRSELLNDGQYLIENNPLNEDCQYTESRLLQIQRFVERNYIGNMNPEIQITVRINMFTASTCLLQICFLGTLLIHCIC